MPSAREAVRVRQVLIDIPPDLASGAVPFAQESAAALKEKVDKAVLESLVLGKFGLVRFWAIFAGPETGQSGP